MELTGKTVLVTGASRGIGAALSAALRDRGCSVTGIARTAGKDVMPCDVTDAEQVQRLRADLGPVDILINNAGVIHEPAPVTGVPLSEWRRLFETNLFGMVSLVQAFLPAMETRNEGWIFNLSSTWGRSAAARQAPYCATKFAVEALSRSLASEVATGVAVVAVNPGVVATEMLATCFESDVSGFTSPAECAAGFVRLMELAELSWNGRSLDVAEF